MGNSLPFVFAQSQHEVAQLPCVCRRPTSVLWETPVCMHQESKSGITATLCQWAASCALQETDSQCVHTQNQNQVIQLPCVSGRLGCTCSVRNRLPICVCPESKSGSTASLCWQEACSCKVGLAGPMILQWAGGEGYGLCDSQKSMAGMYGLLVSMDLQLW